MTPSHATKAGKRYRYYVNQHADWRIPAPELELAIESAIANDRSAQFESLRVGVDASIGQITSVRILSDQIHIDLKPSSSSNIISIVSPFTLRRRGIESRIALAAPLNRDPDIALIKRIVRSMDWIKKLKQGESISDIAYCEGITPGHITHHVDLGFASPKILAALLAGTQRPDISVSRLSKIEISPTWVDQDALFLD